MAQDNTRRYLYKAPPPASHPLNDQRPGITYPNRVVTSSCGHDHGKQAIPQPIVETTRVVQNNTPANTPTVIRHSVSNVRANTVQTSPAQNKSAATGFFTALTVNDQTFDRLVLQSSKPVIVVFTLPSCTACTSLKNSAWQALHHNFKEQFNMYEFVCSSQTLTDKEHDISGHPALLFFNKGEEIGVYLGYSQYEYYASYIKTLRLK